jgi:hypothetical protein
MPDAVWALSDAKYDGMVSWIIGEWHGFMLIGTKPGFTAVEATANVSTVAIEDDVFTVNAAGEPGPGDFHLGGFMACDPSVSNGDSPEHCGMKVGWGRHGVYVTGLVAHFVGDSRIIGYNKRERRSRSSTWGDHGDGRRRNFVRDDGEQAVRGLSFEDGNRASEEDSRGVLQILAGNFHACAFGAAGGRDSRDVARFVLGER